MSEVREDECRAVRLCADRAFKKGRRR